MNNTHAAIEHLDAQQMLFGDEEPPCEAARKFLEFHAQNPHVYRKLIDMLRMMKNRGRYRIGMQMLFEVLRWQHNLSTSDADFKLNNNYGAWYTRLIRKLEPNLGEILTYRTAVADANTHLLQGGDDG